MEQDDDTPRISLGKLVGKIKDQPLQEKLLFYSQVVMVGSSTLPWVRGHAGVSEFNAWQLGWHQALGMLVPTIGLAIQLAVLSGLRRGDAWSWLTWYRFAFLGLATVLVYDMFALPMKGFGYWLCAMGFCIQTYALFPLLDAHGLLPFHDRD